MQINYSVTLILAQFRSRIIVPMAHTQTVIDQTKGEYLRTTRWRPRFLIKPVNQNATMKWEPCLRELFCNERPRHPNARRLPRSVE